jgi:hypothetical protein
MFDEEFVVEKLEYIISETPKKKVRQYCSIL